MLSRAILTPLQSSKRQPRRSSHLQLGLLLAVPTSAWQQVQVPVRCCETHMKLARSSVHDAGTLSCCCDSAERCTSIRKHESCTGYWWVSTSSARFIPATIIRSQAWCSCLSSISSVLSEADTTQPCLGISQYAGLMAASALPAPFSVLPRTSWHRQ